MKKKILEILLVIGLIGLAGFAVGYFTRDKKSENPNTLVLYGNVDIREVNLAFQITERIMEITVEEGSSVEKGQLMARLRPDLFKSKTSAAKARVKAQREEVAKLESGTREQEIQKAVAQVESAQQEYRNARRTSERLKSLSAEYLVSEQAADDAKAAADMAAARLKVAKETLKLLQEGPRKEDIAAAKNKLDIYASELEIARQNLKDTVLSAPSAGIVRNRVLQEGDMAFPQRPVFTLALIDPVWIRTYVTGPQLGKIVPGMPAVIKTDSYPDKSYEGWVGYISPTSEFTPKSVQTTDVRTQLVYQIRVFVCNPENQLRLGMPVTVKLDLNQTEGGSKLIPKCGSSGE